jgi:hypothetical protein
MSRYAILITVKNMTQEEAAAWARHTTTFEPYVVVTKTLDNKKRYGIVRLENEKSLPDYVKTNIGLAFRACSLFGFKTSAQQMIASA